MPVTVNHRASVVCPRALVADLELRLAAAAQRHNRGPTTWLAWERSTFKVPFLRNAQHTSALSYSQKVLSRGQCVTCSDPATWSRAPSHANSHSSWTVLHPPHAAISFQTKSFEFVFIIVYLLLSFQRTLCKSMEIFSNKKNRLSLLLT